MNDDTLSPQSFSIEPPRRDRITAISSAVQRRPIVLVLGMHRSGTSLCSHILSALGVDMSDDIDVNPSNTRGHWERREIVEFHDRILGLFNRDFLGKFHDFALPVAWWADRRVAQIRREIVAFLERRMGEGYFGFKDPRTVRLMPVWHQILNELKLAPRVVLCLRNPAQVARSLNARDGLDPEIGEYRWLVHMMDFYRYTRNLNCCAVEYEQWFDNPAANIEKLRKFLDLPWQQSEADLALLMSDLIDPAARHDDTKNQEANQPLVRTLYKLASSNGQDDARHQIDYIVSQFVSFQQLQRPLLQAFESVAETAAKHPEIEREAAGLRALVDERDAGIGSAELRANVAEARLADAFAEIEGQRVQIAEFAAERDARVAELSHRADDLFAAQQVVQVELAAREAALQHAEQEAHESAVAAEAMQVDIAALREALAQAESEVREREAAAKAIQAEVGALREALPQARHEAQRSADTTRVLQGEIAVLRERLARTERQAEERAAAAAALQAQIGILQGTLDAARHVGKAAIAAIRIETAAPTTLNEPLGWRRAVMRPFGARWSL